MLVCGEDLSLSVIRAPNPTAVAPLALALAAAAAWATTFLFFVKERDVHARCSSFSQCSIRVFTASIMSLLPSSPSSSRQVEAHSR